MAIEVRGVNLAIVTSGPGITPARVVSSADDGPAIAPDISGASVVAVVAATDFTLVRSVDVQNPLGGLAIAGKDLSLGGDVLFRPLVLAFPANMVGDAADGEVSAGGMSSIFSFAINLWVTIKMTILEGADADGRGAATVEILGIELIIVGHNPRPGSI